MPGVVGMPVVLLPNILHPTDKSEILLNYTAPILDYKSNTAMIQQQPEGSPPNCSAGSAQGGIVFFDRITLTIILTWLLISKSKTAKRSFIPKMAKTTNFVSEALSVKHDRKVEDCLYSNCTLL